ncbi:hypothetical protein Scep_000351 [Stephania cephalantha]|uniref:Uncharacterized protein n=1 Tax=Stephania cephalantha TaxID=152367 RepID=A0AAP0Q2V0_9MAGN
MQTFTRLGRIDLLKYLFEGLQYSSVTLVLDLWLCVPTFEGCILPDGTIRQGYCSIIWRPHIGTYLYYSRFRS